MKYELKTMDLYTSNPLDIFPLDDDIFIVCDSHIELLFKKKKNIMKTYGYWITNHQFVFNWCSSYIHILNKELDTVLYLRSYVIDIFNDDNNTYYCEIVQKGKTYIADIYLAPRKKVDSILLLKNPSDVLTVAKIKKDTFLVQYFNEDNSNDHLTVFFKNKDIINTIYYLPIFRIQFIYDYRFTLIYTRGCIMIVDEENIEYLIHGKTELAIMIYYSPTVEPIITKDQLFLICIERDHDDLFLTAIQLYGKFDSIKRKLPKLNYSFVHYDDNTHIINIGTDIGGVIEFNLFDDGYYENP